MKKVKFVILAAVLLLVACEERKAIETETKGDFKLELLFEKDGCKMYRFCDGRNVYWSTCEGRTEYHYRTGGKHKKTVEVQEVTNEFE